MVANSLTDLAAVIWAETDWFTGGDHPAGVSWAELPEVDAGSETDPEAVTEQLQSATRRFRRRLASTTWRRTRF